MKQGETGRLYGVNVQHRYLVSPIFPNANGARLRHNCLASGWWCFLNLSKHPLDLIPYLKRKLVKK